MVWVRVLDATLESAKGLRLTRGVNEMRNLKLKQVLPVDTETETLQKFSQADRGLHSVSGSTGTEAPAATLLHSVKDTPDSMSWAICTKSAVQTVS